MTVLCHITPITTTCDHNLISFSIQSKIHSHVISKSNHPNFRKADYNKISDYLNNINWNQLNFAPNFQDAYNIFLEILHKAIQKYIPLLSSTKNSKIPRHIKKILTIAFNTRFLT